MKILLLDNYDSFTYNLLHAVKELGATVVEVVRNDQITLMKWNDLIRSYFHRGREYPKKQACYCPLSNDMHRQRVF